MDFKDQLKQLSDRVSSLKEQIQTEEATKNAFIMPFIQMLGYDVFNPLEVVPEMDCDISKKKGEKIDYAILRDGNPVLLIECKHWKQDLDLHDTQLSRYFVSSKARFGLLTNGIKYRFYTDLEQPNIMDKSPFLEIDLECYKDSQVEELKKFHKSYFAVDAILSTASELKYMSDLRNALKAEFSSPSVDFVRLFARKVYDGTLTQKVVDSFSELVKRSVSLYINDLISERLNVAIQNAENGSADVAPKEEASSEPEKSPSSIIETTDEELEAFYVVKSILRQYIDCNRIAYKDVQTYFGINVDGKVTRTVCRLYFSSKKKTIVIYDSDKNECSHSIEAIDDIYLYQEELKSAVSRFL